MGKKVLLVEDDVELCELIRLRLEQNGYEVISTTRGDEAVTKARDEKPDVIVMDVFLPHMDGFTALKEIRYGTKEQGKATSPMRDVPIIVMTGRAPMMEEMFRLEGATDFMTKPMDIKALVERIDQLVAK